MQAIAILLASARSFPLSRSGLSSHVVTDILDDAYSVRLAIGAFWRLVLSASDWCILARCLTVLAVFVPAENPQNQEQEFLLDPQQLQAGVVLLLDEQKLYERSVLAGISDAFVR